MNNYTQCDNAYGRLNARRHRARKRVRDSSIVEDEINMFSTNKHRLEVYKKTAKRLISIMKISEEVICFLVSKQIKTFLIYIHIYAPKKIIRAIVNRKMNN